MKKLLAMVLALVMALSLMGTAFASDLAGTYDITIWAAENAVELTKKQVEDFNASNELGITFNATVEPVSEADAATQMVTDVEAGGDLFCFAQDQFARLVQAGALAKLGVRAAETVTANNAAGVVAAATSGDALFAYPLTADNGYFLYYDKSVIPDEDVDSLEKIIADCEAAQKYFAFEMQTSAWYLASFFFGTGCVSEWTTDDDGAFISVRDTFNSPNGLIAVKGMKKLVDSPYHLSSSAGAEFAQGAAAVVTGTWDYTTVEGILGENMGVADLPYVTEDGKGVSYNTVAGAFYVPKTAKYPAEAYEFAKFICNECPEEAANYMPIYKGADMAAATKSFTEYTDSKGEQHSDVYPLDTAIAAVATPYESYIGKFNFDPALSAYNSVLYNLFETNYALFLNGEMDIDTWCAMMQEMGAAEIANVK